MYFKVISCYALNLISGTCVCSGVVVWCSGFVEVFCGLFWLLALVFVLLLLVWFVLLVLSNCSKLIKI